jgi:glyoxylate utilization-related uncharacterized protein
MFPLEGYPTSRLPNWPDAEVRVLAAPALGARFVQYLIDLPAGKSGRFDADDRLETFYFVLSGSGEYGLRSRQLWLAATPRRAIDPRERSDAAHHPAKSVRARKVDRAVSTRAWSRV